MRKALLWAVALALLAQLAGALNDYWNHFCGPKDNCYELLNVPQVCK